MGHCLLDRAQRDAAFAAAVSDGDLARVAAWPGAYSAIVIRGRAVTAYADVSEQFPLYYSRRGEEILVAGDAAALAAAHDRGIDPLTAAAEIACPSVLPAWQTRSPYAGVSRVPAIVFDAPSFQYIAPMPALFDHEVAFSDRAPRLADFWDDSVSADALQPAVRKVVHIRAEEFVVQG